MNNQDVRVAKSFLGLQQESVIKRPLYLKQKLLYLWLCVVYVGILPVLLVQKYQRKLKCNKRFSELERERQQKILELKEEHLILENEIEDLHYKYHGIMDDAMEVILMSKYVRMGDLERRIGDIGGKI